MIFVAMNAWCIIVLVVTCSAFAYYAGRVHERHARLVNVITPQSPQLQLVREDPGATA